MGSLSCPRGRSYIRGVSHEVGTTVESTAHPRTRPFASEIDSAFFPHLLGLGISSPRSHSAGSRPAKRRMARQRVSHASVPRFFCPAPLNRLSPPSVT